MVAVACGQGGRAVRSSQGIENQHIEECCFETSTPETVSSDVNLDIYIYIYFYIYIYICIYM